MAKEIKKDKLVKEETPAANNHPLQEAKTPNRKSKIYLITGFLILLVGIFFISNYIFSNLNNIEYNGLTFAKESFGEIPVFSYSYYITPKLKYNLYLRNDPRKNNVPLTGKAIDNGIEFLKEETIYLSVDPKGLTECEYGRVGIGTLASFLSDNQLKVVGAAPDEALAAEVNVKFATCEYRPQDKVILLQAGDKTEIIQDNENCIVINVANCEILDAVEKFEVQSIIDARDRRMTK
ncbi:MAG: hypothetical protein Q7S27_06360 [Nanoarchaeota archaeon]|nr:hypothetical protein [Nanoarchaeota archaeon]